MSGFAATVAAATGRATQYGADSFFDQTGLLTNFERSHWAEEKPYDRDRANYIKNAVEKAGCENLESWRMLSKEPNILS